MTPARMTMLTGVLEKLALGEYGVRCDISAEDDALDSVAGSINVLAEKLESAVTERNRAAKEQEALNRQLEQRIEDRTAHFEESEAKLKAIFRNSPSIMFLRDSEGKFLLINPEYERLWGLRQEEILGKSLADTLPSEVAPALSAEDSQVLETGQPLLIEQELRRNGDTRTYLVTKFPIQDQDGQVVGIGGIGTDITERKHTEEALRESEERFRDFAESSADWFWEMDAELRFTYVSPNLERILGLPPEWHYGKTRVDLLGEEFDREWWVAHLRVLEHRQPFRDFVFYRHIAGIHSKWISISGIPVHDADENFTGYRGVGSDVTERVRIETELQDNQRMLQTVVDAVPHWLFAKDAEGRMIMVNRGFAESYGGAPEDFTSKTFRQFPGVTEGQLNISDESDRSVIGNNAPVEFEMTAEDSDGISTMRRVIKVPLRNQAGEAVGLAGWSEDITGRRRAEDALLKQDSIMRKAQQLAHIGSLEWDLVTKTQTWSDEVFRLVGHSPQSFVPNDRHFADTLHPDDKKRVLTVLAETIQGGSNFDTECRVVWPDGSVRQLHVQGAVSRDEAGKPLRMIGTAQDITERKKVEEALGANQRLLQTVFDTIPHSLFVKDANSRFLMVNRVLAGRYDLTSEDFAGKHVSETPIGNPEQKEQFDEVDRTVLAGEEDLVIHQLNVTQADGNDLVFKRTILPFRTEDGEIAGLVGISEDVTGQIRAEEALRASEALFRSIVDHTPSLITLKDLDGRYKMVNRKFEELHGISPEAAMGRTIEELFPPETSAIPMAQEKKMLATGEPVEKEITFSTPDGTQVILANTKFPVRNSQGEIVAIGTISTDITERKKAEAELRAARNRLNDAMESIPDGFALFDADDRLVLANRHYKEVYPKHADALVPGARFEDMLREGVKRGEFADAIGREEEWIAERLRTHANPQGPIEQRLSDGRWLRTEEKRTREGGIVGLRTDITEIKKATEALRESEERFRGTVEHLPLAMIIKDLEGRYQFINQRFEEWFGLSKEDSLGKFFQDLFPQRDAESSIKTDREVMREGKAVEGETMIGFSDGQEHIVRSLKFPLYGANGKVNGVGVILSDLTEQRQAEFQLLQSQKMEAIGQLAGGVAHDFNNMLQVIQGYVRLSMGDANLSSDTQGYLSQVEKASERAASLTRQLLAFSRQQILEKEVFDLNTLIADQMKMLRRVIGEEIELEIHARAPVLPVLADAGMIEQVVMNLCLNARDAMPNGGRLLIETGGLAATAEFRAKNPWASEGSYAVFSVNDDGAGMTPEVREKIFEPFFTTKEQGKGTGLGLSMVYGILKQHEGMITVYSEPDRGTTFTVYLPMVEDAVRMLEKEGQTESAGGSETILIAEDEPEVLNLAVTLLEDKGYTILTATNGQEAIEVFNRRGHGIDLVILDVVMPKMSGHQVLEILRKTKPSLPVLLTTGYSPGKFKIGDLSGNRVKMIQKPYDPGDLFLMVRKMIDGE